MARQRLYDYVFAPGTSGLGTIKVPDRVNLEDFLAIYNTTDNKSIFNFGDPAQGGTVSWTAGVTSEFPTAYSGVTTLTLNFDTSLMSSTDKLAIYIESRALQIEPWGFGEDAIGRFRVSNPESLIDADFEYGLQNTKWQNYSTNNNIPGFFEYTGADVNMQANGYVSFLAGDDVISSNVDTAIKLTNAGSPQWVTDDFALLISQTLNPGSLTTTYVTTAVPSPQERTIRVTSTTGFAVDDNILIIGKPTTGGTTISTSITSTATTTVVVANAAAAGIVDGTYVIVETDTAGVFEVMAVTNVATNTLTVTRRTNGTNSGGANITSGNDIYVVANLEIARVIEVVNGTEIDVLRAWYNLTPASSFAVGSVIQTVSTDVELVQHTAVSTTVNGSQTISRGAFSTTALSAAGAGSLLVRMTGIYNASVNANIPLSAVNAIDHGITDPGEYCTVLNTQSSNAEGINIVSTAGFNDNNFSYYPHRNIGLALGFPLNQTDTIVREAYAFAGADLDVATITSDGNNPSTITVTTTYAHGLVPGTPILCNLTAGTNYEYGIGSFLIISVPTTTTFTYQAKTGAAVSGSLTGVFNVRSNATFMPRPFDGGVILGPGVPTHGASAIRQTKKYFRYQSGKSLLFTSGTMLKPTFDITSLTAAGTAPNSTITVTTDLENGFNPGAIVQLSGINTSGYSNSGYVVTGIVSDTTFTVAAQETLGSTTPILAPQPRVNVEGWHGAAIRAGMFDDQNGVFWECDGQSINAVQRSSTFQVAGLVSVGTGSNLVVGDTVSRFQEQLNNGDVVVIRGMTHTVTSILDEQRMTVVPTYRGVTNEKRIKMCLRQEIRVRQEDFNIDTLDGTGPSGYVLNGGRMQMLGIEYSWYGAGYVQWMIRAQNGLMVPCHRRPNNNVNYEAYMRSGNLPARYEAINESPVNRLAEAIDDVQTTITLEDATDYPEASVTYPVFVMIDSEIIKYSGKSGNQLTGCTRGATFTQWIEGANRSFTSSAATAHADMTGVILISNTCTPLINHWGSSVIMDGTFDGDEGFSFTYNRSNYGLPNTVGATAVAFLMRLSPSVSNGIIGDLGQRDLINRAQLTLKELTINATSGRYLVTGILNPSNVDTANTTWAGLNNAGGGFQPCFSQFAVAPNFTGATTGGVQAAPLNTTGGFVRSGTKVVFSSNRTYANLTPTNVSSSGTGANLSVELTKVGTAYSIYTTAITVQNPGSGYAVGDTLKILGNALGGSTPANDLSLTVQSISADILGGERLFAIPVQANVVNNLDLVNIKQIGTSAVPGTGTYPNGPEVLAVTITALSTQSNPVGEIQLSFQESQA